MPSAVSTTMSPSRKAKKVSTSLSTQTETHPTDDYLSLLTSYQQQPLMTETNCYAGIDASTMVAEGELVDFDTEVEPILEALVGKSIHDAIWELQKEEEESQLKRRRAEIESRIEQEKEALRQIEQEQERREMERDRLRRVKQAEYERKLREEYEACKLEYEKQFNSEVKPYVIKASETNLILRELIPIDETKDKNLQLARYLADEIIRQASLRAK
jgi:hypothetical protein